MKVIAITGTKGKTTLAVFLDAVLRLRKRRTLLICSEGVFKNGRKTKDNEHFLKKHQTSPTVAAFTELKKEELAKYDFVILELSYASADNIKDSIFENKFDVSILTNVYWDHIDGKRIKNRKELFGKKIAILENTKKNGDVFIYTGDSKDNIAPKAICQLVEIRPDIKITAYDKSPISRKAGFDYGTCYLEDNKIYLDKTELLDYGRIQSVFKKISPATDLAVIALSGVLKKIGVNPKNIYSLRDMDRIIPGRFNLFKKNGYTVILDYAHEIKSISLAAKTIRTLFKDHKTTAVVRLSYYRSDDYIKSLTKKIAFLFDKYIIYDKAFSRPRFRKIFTNRFYKRKAGDVARLMHRVLKKEGKDAEIIYNEIGAIKKGIKKTKQKEVLYIMGDQLDKDIATIKKSLRKKARKS